MWFSVTGNFATTLLTTKENQLLGCFGRVVILRYSNGGDIEVPGDVTAAA